MKHARRTRYPRLEHLTIVMRYYEFFDIDAPGTAKRYVLSFMRPVYWQKVKGRRWRD